MTSSIPNTLLHIISETVTPDALETQIGPLFEAVYGREYPEEFIETINTTISKKENEISSFVEKHSRAFILHCNVVGALGFVKTWK